MAKKKTLASKLKGNVPTQGKRKEPLWKGPEEDGITQSLLSRFLVCRERFRLLVVEGLQPAETFNHRMEYGNMWHACEEAYASHVTRVAWESALEEHREQLAKKYPLQQEQINHWFCVCRVQFPIYLVHRKREDRGQPKKTTLLAEHAFRVPYTIPSGRVVLLRGKWDGVSLIGSQKSGSIWLDEHKTKGTVREGEILNQLQFDLQTMLYLVALHTQLDEETAATSLLGRDYGRPQGVVYNVVRRPLSGGVGSIRRHKATKNKPEETQEHFYGRVAEIIEDDPNYFFMRFDVEVSQKDIDRFKREFLNPILEQLCDWWEWVKEDPQNPWDRLGPGGIGENGSRNTLHWRHPFGVWNVLNEGGVSEVDEYLRSGSTVGLERAKTLFGELEEDDEEDG